MRGSRLPLGFALVQAPTLRIVRATKYVTAFREGGSLPGLVEADDDGLYVVKFRGAAQGPRALVAEVIAGELGARQRRALEALSPDLDIEAVTSHLEALTRIVAGDPDAGPIAGLDAPERFRWVASPSSTMIQPSDVHGGVTEAPEGSLDDLFERLVR